MFGSVVRRFCNTSPCFLVPKLRVDMRSHSRFDEISRHPIISKGVKSVVLNLDFYVAHMAYNIFSFAELNAARLADQVDWLKGRGEEDNEEQFPDGDEQWLKTISQAELLQHAEKGTKILEAWGRFVLGDDSAPENGSILLKNHQAC